MAKKKMLFGNPFVLETQNFLARQKFVCKEETIQAVNGHFEGLEENHFEEGIGNLEKRWAKCVELRRNYVEK